MNPEIEELEDILDAILKGVQEALQSGEVLSPEFQAQIAEEITTLTQEIDELYAAEGKELPPEGGIEEEPEIEEEEIPPSIPGPVPPVDKAPHESSNIYGFRYHPESQNLIVKFQGKYPTTNGPTYSYAGVPAYIYDIFRRGAVGPKTSGKNAWHRWEKDRLPSHGAAMNALLKAGQFPYQKLS